MVSEWVRQESLETTVAEDSVDRYLNAIGRISRVTAEEEVQLARFIQRGVYLEDVQAQLSEEHPTSWEKVAQHLAISLSELQRQRQRAERAQERLIAANLRLVVSIAKKYVNRNVPFLDLIQEGNIGLMRATQKYDPEKGYRFSTYATWWIRQGITRALSNQSRTIRLPIHVTEKIRRLRQTVRTYAQSTGRRPNESELSQALAMKPNKIRALQEVSRLPISLETPMGSAGDLALGDLLEDPQSQEFSNTLALSQLKSDLNQVLGELKPIEQQVISLRFGLMGQPAMTLKETGNYLELTHERIRQIEREALSKLRRPPYQKVLQQYR